MNLTKKYVLKLTDPHFSKYIYCVKGVIPPYDSSEYFTEECCFDTPEEAMAHLKIMLKSGWYRPDITETNFEVVEVKRYLGHDMGLFYYTEVGYNKYNKLDK